MYITIATLIILSYLDKVARIKKMSNTLGMDSEKKDLEEVKKKAAKAIIAASTASSVIVGGLYSSPDDLLHPKPVIMNITEDEIHELDELISPRIRKGQSLHHIFCTAKRKNFSLFKVGKQA